MRETSLSYTVKPLHPCIRKILAPPTEHVLKIRRLSEGTIMLPIENFLQENWVEEGEKYLRVMESHPEKSRIPNA